MALLGNVGRLNNEGAGDLAKHCHVRGALEMVHVEVAAWFAQDNLKGDNVTELRVKFIRKIEDTVPAGDD